MPHIENTSYRAPWPFTNGHLSTIFHATIRFVAGVRYERERITLPDDDFVDLDWSRVGSKKLALISHGLEGDSRTPYMKGMVRAFNRRGWDAVAYNFRGCSGEPNKLLRSYHSGATEDLHAVIAHVLNLNQYDEVALIGFSLGGNLTLKYVGERGGIMSDIITKAAAVSVPCDLESCAEKLTLQTNSLYNQRFLKRLKSKVKAKESLLPEGMELNQFRKLKNLREFDDLFTAPINGFRDATDYWTQCSSRQFIHGIRITTLLINAWDDPFLTPSCFPVMEASVNDYFHLETTQEGGHVGFIQFKGTGEYWHESRVAEFITGQSIS